MKCVGPPPDGGNALACSTVASAGRSVNVSSLCQVSKRPGRWSSRPPYAGTPFASHISSVNTYPASICWSAGLYRNAAPSFVSATGSLMSPNKPATQANSSFVRRFAKRKHNTPDSASAVRKRARSTSCPATRPVTSVTEKPGVEQTSSIKPPSLSNRRHHASTTLIQSAP